MEPFDAAEIAHGVAELYEPLAEDRGLALAVDAPAPATVRGNRELLSQALANLLDNAIKYARPPECTAPDGAKPPAILLSVRGEGDRVLVVVSDRGPGIPEADRSRAIERFVRLEQSRTAPGSGLGLSLAAAVTRLHGGDLRLEDNAPGLRVVIDLPRAVNTGL
jgi:signal transduction histidine kinase